MLNRHVRVANLELETNSKRIVILVECFRLECRIDSTQEMWLHSGTQRNYRVLEIIKNDV